MDVPLDDNPQDNTVATVPPVDESTLADRPSLEPLPFGNGSTDSLTIPADVDLGLGWLRRQPSRPLPSRPPNLRQPRPLPPIHRTETYDIPFSFSSRGLKFKHVHAPGK